METNGRHRSSIPGSSTFRRLPTLTRSPFRRSEKGASATPEPTDPPTSSSSFPSLARVVVDDSSLSSALFGTPIIDDQSSSNNGHLRSPVGTSTNGDPSGPQPVSPISSVFFPPASPLSAGFKHQQTGEAQLMASLPSFGTSGGTHDLEPIKYPAHLAQTRIPDPGASSTPGSGPASANASPASGSNASPGSAAAPIVPARSAHRYRDFTLGATPSGLTAAMNLSAQVTTTPMQNTPSFGANGVAPTPGGTPVPGPAAGTDSPQPSAVPPVSSSGRIPSASGSRKPSVSANRREKDDGERESALEEPSKRSRDRDRDRDRARRPPKARERTDANGSTEAESDSILAPTLPSAKVARAPASAMYYSPVAAHGRPPGQALRAHTGTLVGDRIWFIGGVDARSCWRGVAHFDTESLQWTTIEPYGEALPPIRAHTTTLVGEQLYLFGGGDGPTYSNDVWAFDTVTHRWSRPTISSPRGQLPPPRRAHTTVLYRNYLVVFGGGNGQAALNDVWALDVSDSSRLSWQEWRTRGDVPHKKGYHTANLVGDKMIVYGGSDGHASFADVHVLDLKTLTWTLVNTEVKHNRLSHTSTQVGSYLFILGGHNGQTYAQDVLLFNLTTLAWESKVPRGIAPPGRGYHVAILHDARIFISGGYNGVSVFDDLWSLDLGAGAYLPQVTSFVVDETADHLRPPPNVPAKSGGSANRI